MKLLKLFPIIIIIGLGLIAILPLLPPILMSLGLEFPAKVIYTIFIPFCHQKASRSIHLHDYQYAVCTRDIFIYWSLFITSIVAYCFKIKPLNWKYAILLTIPIAINGGYQLITQVNGLYHNDSIHYAETTNMWRMITGTLFAAGVGLAIFPYIFNDIFEDGKLERPKLFKRFEKNKYMTNPFVLLVSIFIINFFFYIFLCSLWLVSSDKYKPSGIIDNVSRIPGLNYEVETGRGDHAVYLLK